MLSVRADELLKTSVSWDGGEIQYPTGIPEITSLKLKIDAGQETPFHCHPVPTLAYILKAKVEVETKGGKKTIFNEGESLVEVMRTVHKGKAIGGSLEIIVFYAGEQSLPNTVLAEDDPEHTHCKD